MDKTKSREKYINQQLESLITELRTSHDKLAQAKVNILFSPSLDEFYFRWFENSVIKIGNAA